MKKAIIIVLTLAAVIAALYALRFYLFLEKDNLRLKVGNQFDCSQYSCAQLEEPGTRLKEYHYCLVDCGKSYIKVEDENFAVIVPAGYELLAKSHLQDLKNCEPLLAGFLGITPDDEIQLITFVKNNEFEAYASAEGSGVFYYKTEHALQSELKRLKNGVGIGVSEGRCLNAHELTHIYTKRLKLPHWANEGLATYVEWKFSGQKQPVECLSDGWRYVQSKNNGTVLYSDLNKSWGSNDDSAQMNWYNSASCVFDFIVKKFDPSAVGGVLTHFDSVAAKLVPDEKIGQGMDRFSTKTFLEKAIAPVLGEAIEKELKNKFKF